MSATEYLQEQNAIPFEWGTSDCIQLAAKWVERLTGINPAASFEYTTAIEAKAIVDRYGDIRTLVTRTLEQDPLDDFRLCQEGDIVLTSFREYGQIIGIAMPPRAWIRTALGPMMPLSLELCLCYWRPECRK